MFYLIAILTIALFVILAVKTDILRDPGTCKDPEKKNSYSLARTQFGVWTIIVFCSFIYLMTQTDPDTIKLTTEVAILLGISAGTTVLGRTIDLNSGNRLIKNANQTSGCSRGFILDILSDKDGVSIHRFQQVLFTLLLIVIYVVKLNSDHNFPVLDQNLLLLSGISSGGYLGVKMNEIDNK